MTTLRLLLHRAIGFFRGAALDREMDQEMQEHIRRETERNVANGMAPREARAAALRAFGGMEQIKERERAARGLPWLEHLGRDLRLGVRMLRQSPAFTLLALIILALGIGLNTSMFGVLSESLLRPLPFPESHRLARVFGTSPESQSWALAPRYAQDLAAEASAFASVGLYLQWSATLAEPGAPPEYLMALRVSPEFLPTLGAQPLLGRNFTSADDHPGNDVAILPYDLWTRRFDSDPNVIGREIRLDAKPVTVVGVLPQSFGEAARVFGPVGVVRPLAFTASEREERDQRSTHMVARLADHASFASFETALRSVAARIAADHPKAHGDQSVRAMPLRASGVEDSARDLLFLVAGLAAFVLLIACANLASLQLVRSTGRSRENALRAALGATRLSLARPLVVESLLLSTAGCGAGALVALGCNRWISARAALGGGAPMELALDGRALAFAVVVSIATGLLFGVAPGWLSSRVRASEALKTQSRSATAGRSAHRLRHCLLMGEVALVFVLLTGSGFFLAGIERFVSRDPGWNTRDLAYGAVALPPSKYASGEEGHRFFKELRDRLDALPGAQGTAVGWALPVQAYIVSREFVTADRSPLADRAKRLAFCNAVLPGYFDALRIPVLEGRDFTDFDGQDAPSVAIVNEAMARALWPGDSAIGKRVGASDPENPGWMEVVGVVRDVGFATASGSPATRFQLYRPFAQEPWGYANVAVRAAAPADATIETLREVVAGLDPDVAVAEPSTVRDAMRRSWANFNLVTQLLACFAALGLVLAALGIYGVVAQVVSQRAKEFGVRVALGAQLRDILWLAMSSGSLFTLGGTALGLAGALALIRALSAVSPGLSAPLQAIIAIVTATLLGVALVASWLPARAAAKADPNTALRAD